MCRHSGKKCVAIAVLLSSQCLGGHSKHVDTQLLEVGVQTSSSNTHIVYFMFTNIFVILGLFSNTIFRCYVVLVKKSVVCKLAYSRTHWAIFLADACRQSALVFKRIPKGHENKKHFYMQNLPSSVFQMFALFKILLKVCKM